MFLKIVGMLRGFPLISRWFSLGSRPNLSISHQSNIVKKLTFNEVVMQI